MPVNIFNPDVYRASNPDLPNLNDAQLSEHFINNGVNEKRVFSQIVNLDVYRQNNPDLVAAGLTSDRQLYEHLRDFGVAEGRVFSQSFDTNFYRNAYPDLAAAGLNTNEELFEHFQTFGFSEGRLGAPQAVTPPSSALPLVSPSPDIAPNISPPVFPINQPAQLPGSLPVAPSADESFSFPPLPSDTGDSLNADLGVGLSNFNVTFNDVVGGSSDLNDFYRFNLSNSTSFNLSLSGSGLGLEIYGDRNQDGILDPDEVFIAGANGLIGSPDFGGPTTSFGGSLVEGTYYVRVFADAENSNYRLSLSAFGNFGVPEPIPVF